MLTATEALRRLNRPASPLGLAAFRALFGALMLASSVRFLALGWLDSQLLDPSYHFTYLGFDWVAPLPRPLMYACFGLLGTAALGLCLGVFTRLSAAVFALTFTYFELIDKTTYLNHYYFVSLVAGLLVVLPSNAAWSIDAWRRPARYRGDIGVWAYVVLRALLTLVYFFAGFAKLDGDWLFEAEPLRTWLFAHGDVALIGPLLRQPAVAYLASIGGAVFDLSVGFLFWRRSLRGYAYAAAVLFHVSVWALFPIGIFSWVMLIATTLYFEPSWPLRFLPAAENAAHAANPALPAPRLLGPAGALALGLFLLVQALIPLRFLAYPGNPNWTEDAFRFAWRVMLMEKTGSVEFRVVTPQGTRLVLPRTELTPLQVKMMSTQPDMIHEYALHLAARSALTDDAPARVYADAFASLNGRPSQPLIDPTFDLAAEPRSLRAARFVVPLALPGELRQAQPREP